MHSLCSRLLVVVVASMLGCTALTSAAAADQSAAPDQSQTPAPIVASPDAVPNQYIVTLHESGEASAAVAADALGDVHGGTLLQVYDHALHGFAASMTDTEVHDLARNPAVASIQQDSIVEIAAIAAPAASWGLDRVDQRDLPLDNAVSLGSTGAGVHAYVVDTGIRMSHADFGGRATLGIDVVGDGQDGNDCNGHGTHVAGTIGGAQHGVANAVSLVAVRVIGCSGQGMSSSVIAGVDWVTAHAARPAVANVSLVTGANAALDTAVKASIASGITYTVAGGNSNRDACATSPSRVTEALVVGATDRTDTRASFSNVGACLDVFAPGVDVVSDWYTSDTATRLSSGTSMAAPHVGGVAAQYISRCPAATPAQVATVITANATPGNVRDAGTGSPNRSLFSGFVTDGAASIPMVSATPARGATHVAWTSPTNGGCPLTGYAVYRSTTESVPAASPLATLLPDVTAYDDTDVVDGTTYHYQVGAINALGEFRSVGTSATPQSPPHIASGAGPLTTAGVRGTPVSVTTSAGAVVVIARGQDNALYRYRESGNSYRGWELLGGILTANPVAVSDDAGVLVLGRGLDNALYYGRIDTAGAWSGWKFAGGILTANITATVDRFGAVVFVRGLGDAVWYGRIATDGTWSGWNYLGGIITSDPVSVTDGTGVSVVVRGLGGAVWYGRLVSGTAWTGWRYLGGQITSNIAATVDGAGTEIFVRGLGDTVWHGRLTTSDAWTGWRYLGGQITSDPVAVRDGSSVEVLVNGLGGALWHGRLTNGTMWSGWNHLGGILTANPAAAVTDAGVEVVGSGLGGALWRGRLTDGTTWSGWRLVI